MINKRKARQELFVAALQGVRKYIASRPTALPDAVARQAANTGYTIEVQSGDTIFDIIIKERA